MSGTVHGSCHCGAVNVIVSCRPDYINECNCTLCTKTGFRGVYFSSSNVEIVGPVVGYVRSDIAAPMLTTFHCTRCGCFTHWEPLTPPPHERMGVNARLLDDAALAGIAVHHIDGRSWED